MTLNSHDNGAGRKNAGSVSDRFDGPKKRAMRSKRSLPSSDAPRLRAAAESRFARGSPSETSTLSAEELLHELQVHQIELEMQNDALRQTQVALEESRDRYVDLYEFAPVGYFTLTAAGLINGINLTGATLLGEDRRKLRNRRFSRFVISEERDRWERHFLHALRHDGKQTCELSLLRTDGTVFNACLDCLLTTTADTVSTLRVTLTDITARKQAEVDLRIAAIAFESQEGMIVTDPKSIILRVNRAFTQLSGFSEEEVVGQTPALLKSGRHDQAFYQKMWQAMTERGYWQGEIWNRRKNGDIYAAWLTISAVTAPDGATTHNVGTFSEITEKKEAEAKIHRLAYYDSLTHLPNRRLLYDRIKQALVASSRSGHFGALLFLDLDNFKTLNDTRGHNVGDLLLVEMARRIQTNLRAGDTVARLGGDEFVLMVENLSADGQEALTQIGLMGEKIREALAQPCNLGGQEFHCTASLGVALFRGNEKSIETLLKHADLAMYQAKSAGRDTLRFFETAMQTSLDERSVLEADLRLALSRGQLRLHYQAQVDSNRHVIGAEALLRWEHPKRGFVLPDDFIPLAEETGLIRPIGKWVLETACAQIKAWSTSVATRDLRLAVNVSARQFRQLEFVAQIKRALAQTGADPTRLKIELTESLAIDNVAETIARMQTLKALGVGFSMDDFGTGFSSLSNLKRLPLDQLKIDRAFIRDLASDLNDVAIVQTIITMGKTLGLDVIAEGVETEAQLERLKEYGCVAYQGFLFAQPMPLAAFEEFVTH